MRRRRRRALQEEAVNHERWLVSYADFMTLMFALFVVLFASSYHDKRTLERVSAAVQNGFKDLQVFSANTDATDTPDDSAKLAPINQIVAQKPGSSTVPLQHSGIDLVELQKKLNNALGKEIERKEVVLHMTPEGFVISLHELGFFNSGEARLLPGASDKIKRIAGVLNQNGLEMRIEGNSDNVPIHNAKFKSNWDLSTGRAMAVGMMLIDDAGFDPTRMSIAGYGQYHPVASNDTSEGRRSNRRVDIVVVAMNKPLTSPAK